MVRKLLSSCRLRGGSSDQAVTPLLLVCSLGSVQAVLLWAGKEILLWAEGGCVSCAWPEQSSPCKLLPFECGGR